MIQHEEKLGNYADYSYVYYDHLTEHLKNNYIRFEEELKKLGYVYAHDPDDPIGGILLENDQEAIAGLFYANLAGFPNTLKILTTFVAKEHRGNKIYQTFHSHLNKIAKQINKKNIVATVHPDNKLMLDTISCLDGYKVILHTIHRKVPD